MPKSDTPAPASNLSSKDHERKGTFTSALVTVAARSGSLAAAVSAELSTGRVQAGNLSVAPNAAAVGSGVSRTWSLSQVLQISGNSLHDLPFF